MPPELDSAGRPDPDMWRSVEEWMDSDRFRELMRDEFPEDADAWLDPISRRKFLTLMGASAALAGAGCNPSVRPASPRTVVPYIVQPEQILPNVPLFFATAMPQAGGVGLGVLVKSNEGRPTKIEGNPSHPASQGTANIYALGSVLGVYDPDRSKECLQRNVATSIDRVYDALRDELTRQRDTKGAGIRVVTGPTTSPTFANLVAEFLGRFPQAKWVQYEPFAADNATRAAAVGFGKPVQPVYHFDKVKVALALDSDFLAASCPADVRYARDFMAHRKVRTVEASLKLNDGIPLDSLNRLYAVEAMMTNTGGVADHRLPLKPSQIGAFARALAAKLGVAGVQAPADLPELAKQWIDSLAADLTAHKGAAAVIVGDTQPPAVHLIAHAINEKLGAVGQTVTFAEPIEPQLPAAVAGRVKTGAEGLAELAAEMKAGKVELAVFVDVNPVFDAPADLDFAAALDPAKVRTRVHHGLYRDETAAHCNWHVNAAHYLETWGDVRSYDGTATIQQPLIAPIYGGKAPIELIAELVRMASGIMGTAAGQREIAQTDALELVKATWHGYFDGVVKSGDFDGWWQHAVKDGVVPGTAAKPTEVGAVKLDALTDKAFATPAVQGMEIQYRLDLTVYDGRFANNGWLQELPKPVTKLTWDNAAIVSPRTAAELGCDISYPWTGGENGRTRADMVQLTLDGRSITAAVLIQPGHADGCVTLHVGYGRERAGQTGTGTGFNAYKLRTTVAPLIAGGLDAKKTGANFYLACTNSYYYMESRRPVRHATVEQFQAHPEFAQIPPASASEFKEIRALTPGTPEDFARLGQDQPFADAHAHPHVPHDTRMVPLSLYPQFPQQVDGQQASKSYRRWGLAIDLGACTGCSACVIACVSENNTPVIGKHEVTRGRAMHWLRIDRYFTIPGEEVMSDELGGRQTRWEGRAELVKKSGAIRAHFQPMMCVQCEKAPCEVVCPVGATVHSADGLNDMVYNRCVGTRYCSNNCPYKVRRFNFFQFADYATESLKLLNNPDVTVRQRGVMEKCTYCVQRIRNAEIHAEREFQTRPKDGNGRPKIADGEVITACQAACPTGAITFGDINDHESQVLRWKAERHGYGVMAELGTMPRTTWLAQIRNLNPAMPKGA
ncbi:MAG TPA: TAT-variant-translocated molybdopterin oxidoreductase [Fimbriiglobus sp.]|nr:TAT-variant-translocated molybdopterin oxidoreductase [Fimbriiglobus sp.]